MCAVSTHNRFPEVHCSQYSKVPEDCIQFQSFGSNWEEVQAHLSFQGAGEVPLCLHDESAS